MKRILSIDGGGIRGVIPASILVELENRAQTYAGGLFDMVAGTSTGGIIACGLSAGIGAQDLLDLYVKRGGEIFTRTLGQEVKSEGDITGPKYDAAPLERILKEVLKDQKLSEVTGPKLLVPTYCQSQPGTLFFKSWERGPDVKLRDIARCTSAAETYFPAAVINDDAGNEYVCTDGGTFANNPTMAALSDARDLWPDEEFEILSLGTGGNETPIGRECVSWGALKWVSRITNVFMDGSADTVSYYVARSPRVKLTRIDTGLPANIIPDMDAASLENIAALQALSKELISKFSDHLDGFAKPLP